jgi:hypothetical protein
MGVTSEKNRKKIGFPYAFRLKKIKEFNSPNRFHSLLQYALERKKIIHLCMTYG